MRFPEGRPIRKLLPWGRKVPDHGGIGVTVITVCRPPFTGVYMGCVAGVMVVDTPCGQAVAIPMDDVEEVVCGP